MPAPVAKQIKKMFKTWRRDDAGKLIFDDQGRQERRESVAFSQKELEKFTRGAQSQAVYDLNGQQVGARIGLAPEPVKAPPAPIAAQIAGDADGRENWVQTRERERRYARQLNALARDIHRILVWHDATKTDADGNPAGLKDHDTQLAAAEAISSYGASPVIDRWARAAAGRMIDQANAADVKGWEHHARRMSDGMRRGVLTAPLGDAYRDLMEQQVSLIKSIPEQAAQRVHDLALEARAETGRGYAYIASELLRTTDLNQARANLIARTETARAASVLTQVRAVFVGGTSYIWRSVGDARVRNVDGDPVGSHRLLNGTVQLWAKPPVAMKNGTTGHPGTVPNCRCWSDPIIPGFGVAGDMSPNSTVPLWAKKSFCCH